MVGMPSALRLEGGSPLIRGNGRGSLCTRRIELTPTLTLSLRQTDPTNHWLELVYFFSNTVSKQFSRRNGKSCTTVLSKLYYSTVRLAPLKRVATLFVLISVATISSSRVRTHYFGRSLGETLTHILLSEGRDKKRNRGKHEPEHSHQYSIPPPPHRRIKRRGKLSRDVELIG